MKTGVLTLIAAFVAAVSLALSGGYAVKALADENAMMENLKKGTVLPDTNKTWSDINSGYAFPGNVQKTCRGEPLVSSAKVYYFGYKRLDGFCMTREVVANSPGEAQMCAKAYCPNCSVEDLTLRHDMEPSTFTSSVVYAYCPAK